MKKLKQKLAEYEKNCNAIVEIFAKKQDLEFDYWIGDEVGSIAVFNDHCYFFNLSDIIIDLETDQPKSLIMKWNDDGLEFNELIDYSKRKYINYKSYIMGLRLEDLNETNQ